MKKMFCTAFALLFLLVSCSSDDNDVASPTPVDNPNERIFMRGSLDGTPFNLYMLTDGNGPATIAGSTGYHGIDMARWYYYGSGVLAVDENFNTGEHYSISFDNMYFTEDGWNVQAQQQAFYTSVSNLPTQYISTAEIDQHLQGVVVNYEDEDDNHYSSSFGNQSGSSFVITGEQEDIIPGYRTKQIIGTFSCKVYNIDNPSEVKTITNGSFKLILSPFD